MAAKRIARIFGECVACGCCEKVCPLKAVAVKKGVRAIVDPQRCVGCGKCREACPASVITLMERGEAV